MKRRRFAGILPEHQPHRFDCRLTPPKTLLTSPLALHLRILYSIPNVDATGGIDERDHFAADGRIRSVL